MYRNTYALIDTKKIYENVKYIVNNYQYDYYIGIVKNNAYNHGIETINSMIKGGINYLAVSSLDEALQIRKLYAKIPILVLEPIDLRYIDQCDYYNISITVESLKYVQGLSEIKLNKGINVHLKVDSGMNRLGFNNAIELKQAYELIKNKDKLNLEGIYSHFATSGLNDKYYNLQIETFEKITNDIDLSKVPIVHLDRSITLVNKERIPFCNACRFGMLMYGISGKKPTLGKKQKVKAFIKKILGKETKYPKELPLNTAFELHTEVMSLRTVKTGEYIGYGTYKASEDMNIATLPIGYADGVDVSFKYVWINGNYCEILADTMDMIMVRVSSKVKIGDKVEIIGKNIPFLKVCENTRLNSYHLFNKITSRVTRKYK